MKTRRNITIKDVTMLATSRTPKLARFASPDNHHQRKQSTRDLKTKERPCDQGLETNDFGLETSGKALISKFNGQNRDQSFRLMPRYVWQQGIFVTVCSGMAYRHLFPRQEFFYV